MAHYLEVEFILIYTSPSRKREFAMCDYTVYEYVLLAIVHEWQYYYHPSVNVMSEKQYIKYVSETWWPKLLND